MSWTPSSLSDLTLERCILREPIEIWGPQGFHEIKSLYRRKLGAHEALFRIMGTFGVLDCTSDMTVQSTQTCEVVDLLVGDSLKCKPMLNFTTASAFELSSGLVPVCKRNLLAVIRNAHAAGYMLSQLKSIISEADFEEKWLFQFVKSR
jgi:hypothetical protein